jgi:hypothetical protein
MNRPSPGVPTVLSLLLCVAVATLWVRSCWYITGVRVITGPPESYHVSIMQGDVSFSQWHHLKAGEGGERRWVLGDERIPASLPPPRAAMWFPGVRNGGAPGHLWFSVSLFYPLVLFALLPALAARRAWQYRRPGVCRACGYDLRATPGRCPECGAEATVLAKSF